MNFTLNVIPCIVQSALDRLITISCIVSRPGLLSLRDVGMLLDNVFKVWDKSDIVLDLGPVLNGMSGREDYRWALVHVHRPIFLVKVIPLATLLVEVNQLSFIRSVLENRRQWVNLLCKNEIGSLS